jgi:diguanylate cyclase (GGDEF)-like protein
MSRPAGRNPLSREHSMLRALLLAGCVAIAVIWAMEFSRGELAAWDRWAYPCLLAALGTCSALLTWWPRQADLARLIAVAAFNAYSPFALFNILFVGGGPPDEYQLLTNLYWLPMAYGTAFVFLTMRAALILSGIVYCATFGVILWHLNRGDMLHWPGWLTPMMSNLAVAQVVYVIVLLAVSRLRADYYRNQAVMETMQQIASTDPLTGLLNRRALRDHLAAAHSLVQRGAQPMSAILIDVDHFKQINDAGGHALGDQALVELAARLQAQLRLSDRLGRWGGEEFLVMAAATPLDAAGELADRIRCAASDTTCAGRRITLSLGVAQCRLDDTLDTLIQRADRALYAAKAGGRNRVQLEDEPVGISPSVSST